MSLSTDPIILEPFTVDEAERVLAGEVDPRDGWEGGYAFTEEPEVVSTFLDTVRADGDPAPFGPYLVRRGHDGAAIGGVNLLETAEDGVVEFMFALVPAARGRGLGVLTVAAAIDLIRAVGGAVARAVCEIDNLPARHALGSAGFIETARGDDWVALELRV